MYKIWKRLWVPVIALALTILGFFISELFEGDAEGAISSISLFIFFPFFIVSLFWAIIKSARQTKRVKQGIEPIPTETSNSISITAKALVNHFKRENKEYKEMNSYTKKRLWKFRAIGIVVMAIGVWVFIPLTETAIIIGTIIFICGGAAYIYPKMNSYNDLLKQISLDKPSTIEEVFQVFKDYKTPLGTPYLAKMKIFKPKVMVFGPAADGFYIYCYLNKDGRIFFMYETFVNTIEKIYEPSSDPYKELNENDYSIKDLICWNSSVWLLKMNLLDVFTEYFISGEILPLKDYSNVKVYTFDEQFKLFGQKFNMCDTEKNIIYEIEGTVPLISITVKNPYTGYEEFKMVKQIDKLLTTYNFYKDGKQYSTFHKDPSLWRDIFCMDTPDGKIELIQNVVFFGTNYTVKMNGEVIGTIMDDLSLKIKNFIFDNSVIFVYDEKYTAILAAMAVMVAREIARDRNYNSSNDED